MKKLVAHMILFWMMLLMTLSLLLIGLTEISLNHLIHFLLMMLLVMLVNLAGYAKAVGKKAGGWWVVNKANGSFKYVPADNIDVDKEVKKLEENVKVVKSNKFKRCYESEEETFRGKPTGNRVLSKTCSFCRYKHSCWENLQELPSLVSKAKDPKIVSYVSIRKEQVA